MSIPCDFDPLGTLEDRLPYLPKDFPFRSAVIDGVWMGRLASTGSAGSPETKPQNPPRYLYSSPYLDECLSAPFVITVLYSLNDHAVGIYDDQGRPFGMYQVRAIIGAFRDGIEYSSQNVNKSLLYSYDRTANVWYKLEATVVPNAGQSLIAVPDRARLMLVTSTAKATLFLRRVLTAAERQYLYDYVTNYNG